jgi:hypothetical protein
MDNASKTKNELQAQLILLKKKNDELEQKLINYCLNLSSSLSTPMTAKRPSPRQQSSQKGNGRSSSITGIDAMTVYTVGCHGQSFLILKKSC